MDLDGCLCDFYSPYFARFGKPAKIAKLFGGKSGYEAAINELEMEMYQEDEVS